MSLDELRENSAAMMLRWRSGILRCAAHDKTGTASVRNDDYLPIWEQFRCADEEDLRLRNGDLLFRRCVEVFARIEAE